MPFYKDLVTKNGSYANENLRVLIYNGDTDPVINTLSG